MCFWQRTETEWADRNLHMWGLRAQAEGKLLSLVWLCSMLNNFGNTERKGEGGVHQKTRGEKVRLRRKKGQICFWSQTAREVGGDNTAWFLVDEVMKWRDKIDGGINVESKGTERKQFFQKWRKEGMGNFLLKRN